MSNTTKTLVVIGAGFAGYWAALAARYAADSWEQDLCIRVVNPTNFMTMRPRLYEADPASMTTPLLPLFDVVDVEWVPGTVSKIDSTNHLVTLEDGTQMSFDSLVLTAGSQFLPPPIEGIKDYAHQIEDLGSAVELEKCLKQLAEDQSPLTIVILGAGFTGIELACELRSRLALLGNEAWATEAEITLLDSADVVGTTLGKGLEDKLTAALEKWNITIYLGRSIQKITKDQVELDDGRRLQAKVTVACVGSRANRLTETLSSELDNKGRLVVDQYLAVSKTIFSAGDCASALADGEHRALMSCQHAMPMGRFAGYNAAAAIFGKSPIHYEHPSYITCLDLGPNNALVTRGWGRAVEAKGEPAKQQKIFINTVVIYPQLDTRENMLAAAQPLVPNY